MWSSNQIISFFFYLFFHSCQSQSISSLNHHLSDKSNQKNQRHQQPLDAIGSSMHKPSISTWISRHNHHQNNNKVKWFNGLGSKFKFFFPFQISIMEKLNNNDDISNQKQITEIIIIKIQITVIIIPRIIKYPVQQQLVVRNVIYNSNNKQNSLIMNNSKIIIITI